MQYECIHYVEYHKLAVTVCSITLYIILKPDCKLDGGCKILTLLTTYNSEVKILICKTQLLK